MTKKILFTDLDGTLLDDNKQVSPRSREIFQRFCEAGNYLALSSGRDINSVADVQRELGFDAFPNMFLIGFNGGQIYDCTKKKTIHKVGLPIEEAVFIIETALALGIHCHTYSETHIVSPRDSTELTFYRRIIHTPLLIAPDLRAALTEPPGKCIAVELTDPVKLEGLRRAIEKELPEVTVMLSSSYLLEFFPRSSGKGTAITKLCQILDMDIADSLAAGDQENDLSMLQAAGTGIAMANAIPSLKDACDLVTQYDNNHDGLARELERMFPQIMQS
ncbi:MAG: Cof-type HAD-IIB family hydrolase [Lachnospiraceae bacterium]|jgi:Cof subfamily protein (haloacid dehalogenase superfamily)|nr:Cof-type HAD-IIB family hydrolase [Lachnospiraceae bacterium]